MSGLQWSLFFGVWGGLVRGLVGIAKYYEQNKDRGKLQPRYLFFFTLRCRCRGSRLRSIAQDSWQLALLAGYAGTDFIESLYKIRFKQKFEI